MSVTACARCGVGSNVHKKRAEACEKWVGGHCALCGGWTWQDGHYCRNCYRAEGRAWKAAEYLFREDSDQVAAIETWRNEWLLKRGKQQLANLRRYLVARRSVRKA